MGKTIDNSFEGDPRHDTISIDWHGEDEDLIATALAFYTREINIAMKEYDINHPKQNYKEPEIAKKYGGYLFTFACIGKTRKILNTTKITLTGWVVDARPGKDSGKKIITFQEGYYHKEPFIPWVVGQLLK